MIQTSLFEQYTLLHMDIEPNSDHIMARMPEPLRKMECLDSKIKPLSNF